MHATEGRPTGQQMTMSDGRDWWFDSGSLAIDFAYTGSMNTGSFGDEARSETLHAASDLTSWLTGGSRGGRQGDRPRPDRCASTAWITRAPRTRSRRDAILSDDVDVINLFAATPDIAPSLVGGTRQAGRSAPRPARRCRCWRGRPSNSFESDRPHPGCAADDDCELVFYDESRSNNRRWCSMQRCGNRAKVRAHRARTFE
jgi:hypothetical protein